MVKRPLLVVTTCFPPNAAAGGHRLIRLVRHLSQLGWIIHVLTLDPRAYLPGVRTDEQLASRVPPDVSVHRTAAVRGLVMATSFRNRLKAALETPPASTNSQLGHRGAESRWQRTKDLISGVFSLPDREIGWLWYAAPQGVRIVRRHAIDVVLSSSPPFTCHLVGNLVARATGAKWIADFRDPWSRNPWHHDKVEGTWKGGLHSWLERSVVDRAATVLLNTEQLHTDFADHYGAVTARKFFTMPNGYDADVMAPFANVAPNRTQPFTITHAGSLYGERDPGPVLHAVASAIRDKRLRPDQILIQFIGQVSERFSVAALSKKLGLESVIHMLPATSHQDALRCLAASDVLLILQPGAPLQVPVKLYEYLGLGKPILAVADDGAAKELVTRSGLGLVVPPNDAGRLEEAICGLVDDRRRLGVRFRPRQPYISQFEGHALCRRLDRILQTAQAT